MKDSKRKLLALSLLLLCLSSCQINVHRYAGNTWSHTTTTGEDAPVTNTTTNETAQEAGKKYDLESAVDLDKNEEAKEKPNPTPEPPVPDGD